MGTVLTDGQIALLNNAQPANQIGQLGTNLDNALGLVYSSVMTSAGYPFSRVVKLTSAAAATAVNIITDAEVGTKQVYVRDFRIVVNGATAWTDATATKVSIWDSASSVEIVKVLKAQLTANAIVVDSTASIVLDNSFIRYTGQTAGKGILIKADANFGAGSDIYCVIDGYIK